MLVVAASTLATWRQACPAWGAPRPSSPPGGSESGQGFALSDDPWLREQWWLFNFGQHVGTTARGTAGADVRAPEAWSITTGSADIPVAILDSGVDTTHRDLAGQMWTNPDESGAGNDANHLDDDSNGYIDDVNGWDFVDDDNNPADVGAQAISHGTALAGIVAARGDDGYGITGIAPGAKIMPLRVDVGPQAASTRVQAINYAAAMGAKVVVMAYAMPATPDTDIEADAIRAHPEMLFVAAAGNNGLSDTDLREPVHPCGDTGAPNLICVAATDRNDKLTRISNYGTETVDLAAPGDAMIVLARPPGTDDARDFAYASGTSLAAPLTAGVAALVWSAHPDLTAAEVRQAILDTAQPLQSLAGKVTTGARLDAYSALVGANAIANGQPPQRPPALPTKTAPTPQSTAEETLALPPHPEPLLPSRTAADPADPTPSNHNREDDHPAPRRTRDAMIIGALAAILATGVGVLALRRHIARSRT
jgi:subtilisin family serine protease